MEASVLDVVDHVKFTDFLNTVKTWRKQGAIKIIFATILRELGVDHNRGKECRVDHVAKLWAGKAKRKPVRMGWDQFREEEASWMSGVKFRDTCSEAEREQEVGQEVQEVGQEEQEQEEVFYSEDEEESVRNARRKKSFATAGPTTQYMRVREEKARLQKDPGLPESLLDSMQKDVKKKVSQEKEETYDDDFFDQFLSCFNFINGAGISFNKWDFTVKWIQDFIKRGGDPNKLPCGKTLRKYRARMVPPGLKVTTTMARVPLPSVLDHTAKRLVLRPDVVEYLDVLEDGAVLELLWKWGMDGQSGEIVVAILLYACFLAILLSCFALNNSIL